MNFAMSNVHFKLARCLVAEFVIRQENENNSFHILRVITAGEEEILNFFCSIHIRDELALNHKKRMGITLQTFLQKM